MVKDGRIRDVVVKKVARKDRVIMEQRRLKVAVVLVLLYSVTKV